MAETDELFIVGFNINKHEAYTACRNSKTLVRAAQGVYYRPEADVERLFEVYGLRIAKYVFPHAALTHSTAWYKRPRFGRIFVGGDYPYRKAVAQSAGDYLIVQSMVQPDLTDPLMYELVQFTDPLGVYEVHATTPEMTLIHLMDATKQYKEKHIPDEDMYKLVDIVMARHKTPAAALKTLAAIAEKAHATNEFKRLQDFLSSAQKISATVTR